MIPVFYSQDHKMHHPKYEYDRGLQIPYQEIPERIEYAREYLLSLSFTLEVNPDALLAMDQIARIHSPALIKHLQERSEFASQEERKGIQPNLYSYPWIYPLTEKMREKLVNSPDSSGCFAFDTYAPFGKYTWQAAYSSANLAYCAAQSILKSESQVAYALCRPPGHHAGVEMIGGYCYLNNAAIAADKLKQSCGRGVILDIDYHHGNGTQEIFWDDSEVLFISIHADPQDEYPFFSGFADECGGDKAYRSNLNLPLPKGCDDQRYQNAFDLALGTIEKFQPNWLVLSAGYDTSQADPSTFFDLSDSVYHEIGKKLGQLQLPTVIVHEGGYAVEKNGILAANLLSGFFQEYT